jgi:hypothetical protein
LVAKQALEQVLSEALTAPPYTYQAFIEILFIESFYSTLNWRIAYHIEINRK